MTRRAGLRGIPLAGSRFCLAVLVLFMCTCSLPGVPPGARARRGAICKASVRVRRC